MAEDRYTLIWLPTARRDLHCLDCDPRRLDELMAATLAAAIVERAQILISFPEIGRPMRSLERTGVSFYSVLIGLFFTWTKRPKRFMSPESGTPPVPNRRKMICNNKT